MKICLINNLYAPFARGGAERVAEIISEGLKKDGHDVFIITTRPRFSDSVVKSEETDAKGIKVYYLRSWYHRLDRFPKALKLLWHFWDEFDFISAFYVRRIINREKAEIVMTHNLMGVSFLVPVFLSGLNARIMHVLHDIQLLHPSGLMLYGQEGILETFAARIYQKTNALLLKGVSLLISPSKWLMDEHTARGFFKNSKLLVLPNPVQHGISAAISERVKRDSFRFLFIGHLSEAKGIKVLIKAYGNLLRSCADRKIELILAGAEEEDNGLIDPEISHAVRKTGFVNREKIEELLKSADCLVMPSLCYENSPTVIYEAASFGLPFIASGIGGALELSNNLGGVLFKPGDASDLELKMRHFLLAPDELERIRRLELAEIKKYFSRNYLDKLLRNI